MTCGQNPECDEGVERYTESIIWDSKRPEVLQVHPWPTSTPRGYLLRLTSRDPQLIARFLSPFGFSIKEVTPYRCGFLWLRREQGVLFEREIDPQRTPRLYTQLRQQQVIEAHPLEEP